MDRIALAYRRMKNLGLSGTGAQAPEEVVGHLVAVQSQDFAPGKWSVAQRTKDLAGAPVSGAFEEGRFVRTHVLRPTWHFVAAEDIHWLLELTGPRVLAKTAGRYRQLGLDTRLLARCRQLLQDALAGRYLTRSAVRALLVDVGVSLEDNRLAHILMNAELNGVICSGPVEGKQQTYALLDERCPKPGSREGETAVEELAHRYFTSHGPATLKDFSWWSGLTLTAIKRAVRNVPDIENIEVEGLSYYFTGSPSENVPPEPRAHLLQTFDEYVVGYTESRGLMDLEGLAGAIPNRSPGIVVLDSQVVGHWRRKVASDRVQVAIQLLRTLRTKDHAALEAAAQRYGKHLDLQVDLRVS